MKKRLTSFVLVFALSFSLSFPAFAVDDSNYYSLPPVTGVPSVAMDWPVNPAEFDDHDSTTLTNIYKYIQYLTLSPASWQRNSIVGFLERIFDSIPSNLDTNFGLVGGEGTNSILDDIRKWTMFSYNYLSSDNIAGNLGNIQRNTLNTNDAVLKGNTVLSNISDKVASEITLKSFSDSFQSALGNVFYVAGSDAEPAYSWPLARFLGTAFAITNNGILPTRYSDAFQYNIPYYDPSDQTFHSYWGSFSAILGQMISSIGIDGQSSNLGYGWTLYHYVKNLSETLASEDDKQLAQNYKENREQAEQDFLSGQSGKTSLGKGDFSNASQVGGALNDTFNMGGAAKVSDFLSGFGSAGTESQAWFSQTTSNNLNAVEASDGTSGVSTFADDGETMVDVDPDPYNMADIFSRYDWLEGVDMDD